MTIIIGLGNPGKKYENTRHNVGFMTIDEFARKNGFPDFKLEKKFDALISENEKLLLAKPETFMNESGISAKKILSKKNIEDVIVVHDDIDLPVGKIKIVKDRGSAGHKGVESIIQNIGNNNLIRIRIGIAGSEDVKAKSVVLKKFTKEEQKILSETIQKASEALDLFLREGLDKTMNEYNK